MCFKYLNTYLLINKLTDCTDKYIFQQYTSWLQFSNFLFLLIFLVLFISSLISCFAAVNQDTVYRLLIFEIVLQMSDLKEYPAVGGN